MPISSSMQSWGFLALRGVLLVLFGLACAAWPAVTVQLLVAFFAAYALVGGAAWVFGALRQRPLGRPGRGAMLLGVLGLAAGSIAVLYPAITVLVLVLLMGANALVTGVFDIVMAIELRRAIGREWLLALSGAVSVLFGILVLLFPLGAGLLALVFLVGLYALVAGLLLLAAAVRLRAWARLHAPRSSPAAGSA
jgi:uncharacterized membrane protein HdeD (DUF308 family)